MTRSTILVIAFSCIEALGGCSADAVTPSPTAATGPAPTPVPAAAATDTPAPSPMTTPMTTPMTAPAAITYAIMAANVRADLPTTCAASPTVYNDCKGGPVHLSWKDTGTATPKTVTIDLGVSVFCAAPMVDAKAPQMQSLSINGGSPIGSFEGDVSACTCGASMVKHSFTVDVANLDQYVVGGTNELKIAGPNRCLGLSPLGEEGAVAKITVTYDETAAAAP